jgi:hypothetical protein
MKRTDTTQNRSTTVKPETIAVLNSVLTEAVRTTLATIIAIPGFAELSPKRQLKLTTEAANEITSAGTTWATQQLKALPVDEHNRI